MKRRRLYIACNRSFSASVGVYAYLFIPESRSSLTWPAQHTIAASLLVMGEEVDSVDFERSEA